MSTKLKSRSRDVEEDDDEAVNEQLPQSPSFELAFPSSVYEDFIANNPVSISQRDKLSFVDDKKQWKETTRYVQKNINLNKLTRMLQTEIIRCKPENILDFINDEFFSLENQTKLRNIFRD